MSLGDLTTLGDVTQALQNLLTGLAVSLDSPAVLANVSTGGTAIPDVNLFLYQVNENPFAKNQPWVTRADGVQVYPPLALDLHYLLTPYSTDPVSAHRVLTHAMHRLYLKSTLTGADLADPLRLTVERLTINLCQKSLEELTRIWNALQTPYRLSVSYEVRVVLIESSLERKPQRVETALHVYAQR